MKGAIFEYMSGGLFWLYLDRAVKSFTNIIIVLLAIVVLGEQEYFEFISSLSLFYVFYAVSSLGLDSKVYSCIHRLSIPRDIVNQYIYLRLVVTSFVILLYVCVMQLVIGVDNWLVISTFSLMMLLKIADIYDFLLIGGNYKKEYSKAGALTTIIFFVMKVIFIYFGFFYMFVFCFLLEIIVIQGIYAFLVNKKKIIVNNKSGVFCSKKEAVLLLLNSCLSIGVSRFDQLFLGGLMSKEIVLIYFTLVRIYEPVLTIYQVMTTFVISSREVIKEIFLEALKFHVFLVFISIIHFVAILVLLASLDEGVLDKYNVNIITKSVLVVMTLNYLMNGSRILSGKILVYMSRNNILVARSLVGLIVIFVSAYVFGFDSLVEFLLTVFFALFMMNVLSYYSIMVSSK